MAHPLWPLFDLVITTPRLEVRLPTDAELALLAPHSDDAIFGNSASMPFVLNWPSLPSPDREIALYQHHTRLRAEWKPESWTLGLCAFLDGQPIGNQGLQAEKFAKVRAVSTGSYICAPWQRQGYGTEMRAAAMELAFAGLGALEAHSDARIDNVGSNEVSRRLGYVENGYRRFLFGDEAGEEVSLRLTRDAWEQHRTPGVEIHGLDTCRVFFGADGETWATV